MKLNCPKKVQVIYHYDKEDEDCSGDFYDCEVLFDGKPVLTLTDDYHDGATFQIEGYLYACEQIWGAKFPTPEEINKADRDG